MNLIDEKNSRYKFSDSLIDISVDNFIDLSS